MALSLFALCTGIAIYFALPFEPTIIYPFLISALCAINFILWRKKLVAPVFALLFGFFYSLGYTHAIDIPKITNPKHNFEVSGTVKNIDYNPDKTRVFLKDNKTGALYRLSANFEVPQTNIGDDITAGENCHAKILRGGFVIYKNGNIEYINSSRWWHNLPKQNKDRLPAP